MFELYLLIFLLIIIVSIMIDTLKLGISPMPTNKDTAIEIVELLKRSDDETIIDLGSGFGNLAIFIASNFPNKKVIAYELSFVPYIISMMLKKILKVDNLKIYRKDFLKEDLSNATLVCYLFPKGMEKLEDKLFDDCINTTIISSTFAFRHIKERKIINVDDIYKTPIYYYQT